MTTYNNKFVFDGINPVDYFITSNLFLDNACKLYISLYKKDSIPYDFITFYFNEASACKSNINNYLNKFFTLYYKNINNLHTSIRIYAKSKEPVASIFKLAKKSLLVGSAGYYIEVPKKFINQTFSYETSNTELVASFKKIDDINYLIKSNKQLNIKYQNYLKLAQSKNKSSSTHTNLNSLPTSGTIITGTSTVKAPTATRSPIGSKIKQLIIPKLELPAIYPKSTETSRIDSRYFVYRFTFPSIQIKLLERYKLVAVKLTSGFLNKRNNIVSASSKKNRFSDFF